MSAIADDLPFSRKRRLSFPALIGALIMAMGFLVVRSSPEAPTECSGSPNTPDGEDPWGGCFPGPTTTGVPSGTSLTTYSGSCTPSAGATITEKTINCDPLIIANDGITILRSLQNGQVVEAGGDEFSCIDSEIDGTPGAAAPFNDYTIQGGIADTVLTRCNVHGGRSQFNCDQGCTVTDSWLHGNEITPVEGDPWHASSFRQGQNGVITHSTIDCDYGPPVLPGEDPEGCSGSITGYPDFLVVKNNTYTFSLLPSNPDNPYCMRLGDEGGQAPFNTDPTNGTGVVVEDNVFQKGTNNLCGTYGASTAYIVGGAGNSWARNVWDDGTPLDPNE